MLLRKVVIMNLLMQAIHQQMFQLSVNGLYGVPVSLIVVRVQFDQEQGSVIRNIVLETWKRPSLALFQNAQQINMNAFQMIKEPNGDH